MNHEIEKNTGGCWRAILSFAESAPLKSQRQHLSEQLMGPFVGDCYIVNVWNVWRKAIWREEESHGILHYLFRKYANFPGKNVRARRKAFSSKRTISITCLIALLLIYSMGLNSVKLKGIRRYRELENPEKILWMLSIEIFLVASIGVWKFLARSISTISRIIWPKYRGRGAT